MEVRLSEPQAAENRTETCFLQTDKKRLQIHRQGMQLPERKIPAYKHSACGIAEIPASDNSMPAGSDDGRFSYLRGGKISTMRKPVCAFFYMPVPWCQGIRAAPLQFSYVKSGNPPAAPEGFVKCGCSCGRGHLLGASRLWERIPRTGSDCLQMLFAWEKNRSKDTGDMCTGNTTEKTGRKNGFRRDPLLTKDAAA